MSRGAVARRVVVMNTSSRFPLHRLLPAVAGLALAVLLAALLPAGAGATVSVGLSAVRAQTFENENLLFYVPEEGDLFAYALAVGDFNGDGADDLATGIPLDDGQAGFPIVDMGAVVVRYGIPARGLATGLASTWLSQAAAGNPEDPGAGDRYGWSLAAGDFNGDGIDDLAIGVPWNQAAGEPVGSGAVEIHYGLPGGIQLAAEHFLRQGHDGVPGAYSDYGDRFGDAVAAGDFDGDGYDDLAIGAPRDNNFQFWGAGSVTVLHGGVGGVMPFNGYVFNRESAGIPGAEHQGEDFGGVLAAGDWNGDGRDDLAVGSPLESAPGLVNYGGIVVLFGSDFGLIYANSVGWSEDETGGVAQADDQFGSALASGDFDGDGYDDLVVGAPFKDIGAVGAHVDAGEITVLYGSAAGALNWFNLARTGHWRQSNIFFDPVYDQPGDHFGWAFAAGDFDKDGRDDLAVGHPGENLGGADRGAVTVLMGTAGTGLWSRANVFATDVGELPGTAQDSQDLGRSLAAGDFDGDGHSDLAIGIPYRDVSGIGIDVGRENVLYGSIFSDGFLYGNATFWSVEVP